MVTHAAYLSRLGVQVNLKTKTKKNKKQKTQLVPVVILLGNTGVLL